MYFCPSEIKESVKKIKKKFISPLKFCQPKMFTSPSFFKKLVID